MHIAAVDLKLVPLTERFVRGSQASSAIEKLNQRTPLGSTDMVAGLKSAATLFSADESTAKQIIYIGDGMSRADLLSKPQFAALTRELAKQHISVSSYAIGPHRDVHMLVAFGKPDRWSSVRRRL